MQHTCTASLLSLRQHVDDAEHAQEHKPDVQRKLRARGGKKAKQAPDLRMGASGVSRFMPCRQSRQACRPPCAEQKLEVATSELDQAQKDAKSKGEELNEAIDIQRAVLESLTLRIQDLEKEAYEFKRDVVIGAENPRTGKTMSEKLARWMEEKLKAKDALIEKLRLKNASLRTAISKLRGQLKSKEEMGGVLHYIDFHQLQIENKQYLASIEERNTQLLDLKVSTGTTVQTLNALKQRLTGLVAKCAWQRQEIRTRQERLAKLEADITAARAAVKRGSRTAGRLQVAVEEAADMPGVMHYVDQKQDYALLTKELRNWQRKVEIAEMAARRAKRLLSGSGTPGPGRASSTAGSSRGTLSRAGTAALGGSSRQGFGATATSVTMTPFGAQRRGGLFTGSTLAARRGKK